MSPKKKQSFDLAGFIRGVERPQRIVTLCTDAVARARIDDLMTQLQALPATDDESLVGDTRRDGITAELEQLAEGPGWVDFAMRAPTHASKLRYQAVLADAEKGVDFTERLIAAEATMVVECLASVDGNAVSLTEEQARQMLDAWPDDLTREIVDAINDLGGSLLSVPFSQRLSQTLKTPMPAE